tara:strand:+ start:2941 stop:3132 length:192 start_codon:yes stop_codon:yes gene_type:complete
MKTIDEIWLEKEETMKELHSEVQSLLLLDLPIYELYIMWHIVFDRFLQESFDQDSRIRKLVED